MSKTTFSKSELCNLYSILIKEQMLPCEKIEVGIDLFNSRGYIVYTKIFFVKGKKQLDIGLVTQTHPRPQKLKEQLIKYFGVENDI